MTENEAELAEPEVLKEPREPKEPKEPVPSSSLKIRTLGITAGGTALFLLLRMFAISNWDWQTATEVLGTVNFSNAIPIAFGTLFAAPMITAVLVSLLLPIAAVDLIWPVRKSGRRPNHYMFVAALAIMTVSLVGSYGTWWVPIVSTVIGGGLVAIKLAWQRGAMHQASSWVLRRVGAMAMVAFLVLAAVIRTPWTVREEIVTSTETIEGYVLEVPSGYLTVLTAGDRDVKILVSSDVESRTATG